MAVPILPIALTAAALMNRPGQGGGQYNQAALEEFRNLNVPNIEDLIYKLDRLVSQGELTPEEAETIIQQQTEFSQIQLDPTAQQAQMDALAQLQEIGEGEGFTPMDRYQLSEIQGRIGQQERGSREAIMQRARERGVGGSGVELASQLLASQSAAGRASQEGLGVAAMGQQRALEALLQSGQLAGDIRGQQFGEAASQASAQDVINRFNVANRQDVINANINRRNIASERNLGERQRIADANVAMTNQERAIKAGASQQDYQNQLQRTAGLSGQYRQSAEDLQREKDRQAQFQGQLIGTAGTLLTYGGNRGGQPTQQMQTTQPTYDPRLFDRNRSRFGLTQNI